MAGGASGVPVAEKGIVFDGNITRVINATSFLCPGLSGYGDQFFQNWTVYVVRKVDGTGALPQGEGQACLTYTSLTGTFTHVAFTAALEVNDEIYLIHPGFASLAGQLAALLADVGNASTSVLGSIFNILGNPVLSVSAQLAIILAAIGPAGSNQGLCYRGIVTGVPVPGQFTIAALAGLPERSFIDLAGINPYHAFVKSIAAGTGAAPQAEHQPITLYTSATGNFTAGAFTMPVGVGDEILIIHPFLVRIMNSAGVPGTNGSIAANWNTGVGTSGEAGADLVIIGAPLTFNKLHALIIGIGALAGNVNIKLFANVNGVDTRIFPPKPTTWNIAAGDAPGVAVINGTIGLRNALRVEVFSDLFADNMQPVSHDFLLEHM